jgi:positive regulator of sigma E activity
MRPGDRVEVEVFFPNPAFSACLLFLGPLVLVLGGMIAWPAAVRAGSQGMGLVVGLAAAALWYAGVAAYDRRLRRDPARRPRLVSWSRSNAAAPPGRERP